MKPHEKARAWREKHKLTLAELSELTGYSVIAIRKFEAGHRNASKGEQHSEWVMHRFRMACAGAERQLKTGRAFEW